jgi:hypothetical protein
MCFRQSKYSDRGFEMEPPLKSSQTSQPGLRPCFYATVLKTALQRALQIYSFIYSSFIHSITLAPEVNGLVYGGF